MKGVIHPTVGFLAVTTLMGVLGIAPASAAGPWRAVVLDADTGEPVAGAVVVATWQRRRAGEFAVCFGGEGYYDQAEFVTDTDGRFIIPARFLATWPTFCPIVGPQLIIFKGGYGPWRFQNNRNDLRATDGAVIELRPLRDVNERLSFIKGTWRADPGLWDWNSTYGPGNPEGPYEEVRRYDAAVNYERALLGLPPVGFGFPGFIPEEVK